MWGTLGNGQTDCFFCWAAAGPVYINEVSPTAIRGHIMTFWQLNFSVGSFIAYWIAFACNRKQQTRSILKPLIAT